MKMSKTRRRFAATLALLGLLGTVNFAHGQGNTIRLFVIVAPGGSADAMARIVGEKLGPRLKTTVVVENKPGAGGNLATQTVARAEPDGTSLLLTANNHTINPTLFADAGYELKDLAPIAELMRGPSVVVVPINSPYNSFEDLLADARKHPGTITYGSAGVGTPSHMAGELLAQAAGIKLVHAPYRGSGPSLNDVAGGQIPVVISSLVAATPLIQAKRVRPLAVTSLKRWPGQDSIPAASEFGMPNYEHMTWLGLFAPSGTPPEKVRELSDATMAVLQDPAIKSKVAALGGQVGDMSADAFAQFIDADYETARKLVTSVNMQVN
ncbi:tripartite tricarboxylate transporter substrate binding protein [Bordetella tumulicola]|uniref:tripartite tricarboxylate transporter substrate binding protein n=1 Tax=Bordetella tumulicola TaxID=1649133 RepID=UPI0039EDF82A